MPTLVLSITSCVWWGSSHHVFSHTHTLSLIATLCTSSTFIAFVYLSHIIGLYIFPDIYRISFIPDQGAQAIHRIHRQGSYFFSTPTPAISHRTRSAEAMAVSDVEPHTTIDQPSQRPLPMYSLLPRALKSGLQPLALVRKSLSDYNLRSRGRVTSQVISRSKSEDTLVAGDDVTFKSTSSLDSVDGICWKFARHGKIPHIKTFHN